jgi:two-component system, cell cycle sensor histidine kinase DivJ
LLEALTHLTKATREAAPLPAGARLVLFRRGRLAAAATALGLAAPLAIAAGSPAIAVALLLAGLLPAAVALDRRSADGLGRAAAAIPLILGAVLSAGILRGLPVEAALLLLAVSFAEAMLSAGRRERTPVAATTVFALLLIAAAAVTPVIGNAAGQRLAAVAAVAIAAATGLSLCISLALHFRERGKARRSRFRKLWRGALAQSETTVVLDARGCVREAGRNARDRLGLAGGALLGRGLIDLTLVADRPLLLTACSGGACRPAAIRFRLKADAEAPEPRYRWAQLRLLSADASGLWLASLRDVSDAVAEDERLAEAAAALSRGVIARDAFLSTVNHEARTPLNAIVGFSELLANPATTPADPKRVREYAGLIHEAGHDLLRKISAMIDITRLEAGAYDFAPEPLDAGELARLAVEGFRLDRGLDGRKIAVSRPAQPAMAELDARAFGTALADLLANAHSHGQGAEVQVSVEAAAEGVSLTVRDRGPGFAAEKLRLAQDGIMGAGGGAGLGLTRARGIAALHGGTLRVDNAPGAGAVATLHFPAAGVDAPAGKVVRLADARKTPAASATEGRRLRRA